MRKESKWIIFLNYLKPSAWGFLKNKTVQFLLLQLGTKLGGPWLWIASKILPPIFDKLVKPWWNKLFRKTRKTIRKSKGKKKAKRLRNAETVDDYTSELNRD